MLLASRLLILLLCGSARGGSGRGGGLGAAADDDPCDVRSDDVPCLHAPRCGDGEAAFADFKISTAAADIPATQPTNGTVCWSAAGLHIRETALDGHIFSPYTHCNAPVFVKSDVLEVFLAPVASPTDNPRFYYELDTSPSGAFFANLMDNRLGNSSACIASAGCDHPGTLPCTGRASFPHGMTSSAANGTASWSIDLMVPWASFPPRYAPSKSGGIPWHVWRVNFYRYSYPDGPNAAFDNYELNAWSPTHGPSFHVPNRFGVIVLDPPADVSPTAIG